MRVICLRFAWEAANRDWRSWGGADSVWAAPGDLPMRPKPPVRDVPDDLFRQRLTSLIDARHPLVLLAARIDWAALEARFCQALRGRAGKARLAGAADGGAAPPEPDQKPVR